MIGLPVDMDVMKMASSFSTRSKRFSMSAFMVFWPVQDARWQVEVIGFAGQTSKEMEWMVLPRMRLLRLSGITFLNLHLRYSWYLYLPIPPLTSIHLIIKFVTPYAIEMQHLNYLSISKLANDFL